MINHAVENKLRYFEKFSQKLAYAFKVMSVRIDTKMLLFLLENNMNKKLIKKTDGKCLKVNHPKFKHMKMAEHTS